MIILRQKLYNRHDMEVLREIHAATNGFRKRLNYKGMTPRDVYRLNDFTTQLYQYSKGNGAIDWGEFSTLAKHLGLPKTAKYGRHAIEKFYNPEIIERAKSIRATKAGLGKEWERSKELYKSWEPLEKAEEEITSKVRQLQELRDSKKITSKKYWKKLEELSKQFEGIRAQQDAWGKKFGGEYADIEAKLKTIPKDQETDFIAKLNQRADKAADEALAKSELIKSRKLTPNEVDMAEKIKADAKSKGAKIEVDKNMDGGEYDFVEDAISGDAKSMSRPETVGHEWGHRTFNIKMARRLGFIKDRKAAMQNQKPQILNSAEYRGGTGFYPDNPWYEISDELGATYTHLTSPIMRQATPLERAKQIESLGYSYDTYLFDSYKNLGELDRTYPRVPYVSAAQTRRKKGYRG